MSKPTPARYRTTNWSNYTAALRKRGSLLGGRRLIDPFIRVLDNVTNTLPHVFRKVGAIYLDTQVQQQNR